MILKTLLCHIIYGILFDASDYTGYIHLCYFLTLNVADDLASHEKAIPAFVLRAELLISSVFRPPRFDIVSPFVLYDDH